MNDRPQKTTQAKSTSETEPEADSPKRKTVSRKHSERRGGSTALSAASSQKISDRIFEVRLSIRYHSKRQKHFEIIEAGSNFLLLFLGSGALATTAIKFLPREASIIGMLIAAITAMKIAFGPAYRAARHARFVESFAELEKKLLSIKNDEEIDQVIGELLDLEAKEPPALINLSVICYNEVAISEDQEGYVRPLSRWQGFMARWMDWRPYQGLQRQTAGHPCEQLGHLERDD